MELVVARKDPRVRPSLLSLDTMTLRSSPPRHWGTGTADEARPCPGARFAPDSVDRWFRAVTIDAPTATVFRWLCQLKVAPYSYDLLDNRGRRSPRALTPGADRLVIGEKFMSIFKLEDFRPGVYLTLRMTDPRALRVFGPFTVVYEVQEIRSGRSRLLATLFVGDRHERGPLSAARRRALAWGDLFMMRKQLRTLKALATGGDRRSAE